VVLIGEDYWRRVLDIDYLLEVGSIDAEDLELFWYAETAADAWEGVLAWHRDNGSPLFEARSDAGADRMPEERNV
jgi:hypothetical protein